MSRFELDPRLQRDTIPVLDFSLSRLLLMNDRRYPWLILVPQRVGVRELCELSREDRQQLMEESCHVTRVMQALFEGDKMNVGVLGNIVPQLHLHHIARREDDPAWPGPVWGHSAALAYAESECEARLQRLQQALQ